MQEFSRSLLVSSYGRHCGFSLASHSSRGGAASGINLRALLISLHLNNPPGAWDPTYKEKGKAADDFSGLCLRLHSEKEEFSTKVIAEIYSYIEQRQSTSSCWTIQHPNHKQPPFAWSSKKKFCGVSVLSLYFFFLFVLLLFFSRNGFLFSSQYLLSQWLIWQQVTMIVCCFSAFLNTVTAFLSTISTSDIPLNLVLHLIKMSAWNVSFLPRSCSLL